MTKRTQQAPEDKKVVQKQDQQLEPRLPSPDASSLSGQLNHTGILEMFVLASCTKAATIILKDKTA